MTHLPNRMTDAAYEKALREAGKEVSVFKAELLRAQSAWDNTSARKCGVRGYLATWLQLRKSAWQSAKETSPSQFPP